MSLIYIITERNFLLTIRKNQEQFLNYFLVTRILKIVEISKYIDFIEITYPRC